MLRRIIAFAIIFCMAFEQSGFAQVAPQLGVPDYLAGLLPQDRFRPLHLRSISIDPSTNNYRLLLDKGDIKELKSKNVEDTAKKLLEYFKIGLRLPNSMFWVNLRPDSDSNIIDPNLEKTDMGKVLLAADVQLKKDVARFTSPDTKEGKEYWNKLYSKAESLYGADEDIEIPTVTRPWIVPGEIIIKQTATGAYVYKAVMKVCLEQDWLGEVGSLELGVGSAEGKSDGRIQELNSYSSQLIREIVIPKLTREVNSSKRYNELRQVFYSLVLAQWVKKSGVGSRELGVWNGETVDSKDLTGLTSKESWSKQEYYQAYRKSFRQGEYDKEEQIKTQDGITIRRYFSGGFSAEIPAGSITFLDNGRDISITPDVVGVEISAAGAVNIQQRDAQSVKDGGMNFVSQQPQFLTAQAPSSPTHKIIVGAALGVVVAIIFHGLLHQYITFDTIGSLFPFKMSAINASGSGLTLGQGYAYNSWAENTQYIADIIPDIASGIAGLSAFAYYVSGGNKDGGRAIPAETLNLEESANKVDDFIEFMKNSKDSLDSEVLLKEIYARDLTFDQLIEITRRLLDDFVNPVNLVAQAFFSGIWGILAGIALVDGVQVNPIVIGLLVGVTAVMVKLYFSMKNELRTANDRSAAFDDAIVKMITEDKANDNKDGGNEEEIKSFREKVKYDKAVEYSLAPRNYEPSQWESAINYWINHRDKQVASRYLFAMVHNAGVYNSLHYFVVKALMKVDLLNTDLVELIGNGYGFDEEMGMLEKYTNSLIGYIEREQARSRNSQGVSGGENVEVYARLFNAVINVIQQKREMSSTSNNILYKIGVFTQQRGDSFMPVGNRAFDELWSTSYGRDFVQEKLKGGFLGLMVLPPKERDVVMRVINAKEKDGGSVQAIFTNKQLKALVAGLFSFDTKAEIEAHLVASGIAQDSKALHTLRKMIDRQDAQRAAVSNVLFYWSSLFSLILFYGVIFGINLSLAPSINDASGRSALIVYSIVAGVGAVILNASVFASVDHKYYNVWASRKYMVTDIVDTYINDAERSFDEVSALGPQATAVVSKDGGIAQIKEFRKKLISTKIFLEHKPVPYREMIVTYEYRSPMQIQKTKEEIAQIDLYLERLQLLEEGIAKLDAELAIYYGLQDEGQRFDKYIEIEEIVNSKYFKQYPYYRLSDLRMLLVTARIFSEKHPKSFQGKMSYIELDALVRAQENLEKAFSALTSEQQEYIPARDGGAHSYDNFIEYLENGETKTTDEIAAKARSFEITSSQFEKAMNYVSRWDSLLDVFDDLVRSVISKPLRSGVVMTVVGLGLALFSLYRLSINQGAIPSFTWAYVLESSLFFIIGGALLTRVGLHTSFESERKGLPGNDVMRQVYDQLYSGKEQSAYNRDGGMFHKFIDEDLYEEAEDFVDSVDLYKQSSMVNEDRIEFLDYVRLIADADIRYVNNKIYYRNIIPYLSLLTVIGFVLSLAGFINIYAGPPMSYSLYTMACVGMIWMIALPIFMRYPSITGTARALMIKEMAETQISQLKSFDKNGARPVENETGNKDGGSIKKNEISIDELRAEISAYYRAEFFSKFGGFYFEDLSDAQTLELARYLKRELTVKSTEAQSLIPAKKQPLVSRFARMVAVAGVISGIGAIANIYSDENVLSDMSNGQHLLDIIARSPLVESVDGNYMASMSISNNVNNAAFALSDSDGSNKKPDVPRFVYFDSKLDTAETVVVSLGGIWAVFVSLMFLRDASLDRSDRRKYLEKYLKAQKKAPKNLEDGSIQGADRMSNSNKDGGMSIARAQSLKAELVNVKRAYLKAIQNMNNVGRNYTWHGPVAAKAGAYHGYASAIAKYDQRIRAITAEFRKELAFELLPAVSEVLPGDVSVRGEDGQRRSVNALISVLKSREFAKDGGFADDLMIGLVVYELIGRMDESASWQDMDKAINALVKIGAPAVDPLIAALETGSFRMRVNAAKALGLIGDKRAIEPLIEALSQNESSESTIASEAINALSNIGKPAVEPLIAALTDSDKNIRWRSAIALGRIGDEKAVTPLIEALNGNDFSAYDKAVVVRPALIRIGGPRALSVMLDSLDSSDPSIEVRNAMNNLGLLTWDMRIISNIRDVDSSIENSDHMYTVPLNWPKGHYQVSYLMQESKLLLDYVKEILPLDYKNEKILSEIDIDAIKELLASSDQDARLKGVKALEDQGGPEAVALLIPLLKDRSAVVRSRVALALASVGDASAVEALIQLLNDENNVNPVIAEEIRKFGYSEPSDPFSGVYANSVHSRAIEALDGIWDNRAIEPLAMLLKRSDLNEEKIQIAKVMKTFTYRAKSVLPVLKEVLAGTPKTVVGVSGFREGIDRYSDLVRYWPVYGTIINPFYAELEEAISTIEKSPDYNTVYRSKLDRAIKIRSDAFDRLDKAISALEKLAAEIDNPDIAGRIAELTAQRKRIYAEYSRLNQALDRQNHVFDGGTLFSKYPELNVKTMGLKPGASISLTSYERLIVDEIRRKSLGINNPDHRRAVEILMASDRFRRHNRDKSKDGGMQEKQELGGVDFRAIPVVTAPVPAAIVPSVPVSIVQLDKDWAGISKQLKAGKVPYEQLRSYAAACASNKEAVKQSEDIAACIYNILRLEENAAVETAPQMKEILALVG